MAVSTVSFSERLNRIERERVRAHGRIVLHVGDAEVMVRKLDDIADHKAEAHSTSKVARVVALMIGFVAFALAVAIKARFLPMPTAEAALGDIPMAIGIGSGLAVAALLGPLLGLRGRAAWVAVLCGVVLGASTLHNVAFWAPEPAGMLFTKQWVNLEQAATAPNSIVFRAQVYAL